MTDSIVFKNFFAALSSDEEIQDPSETVREIEELLGDPELTHRRIRYIEELTKVGKGDFETTISAIEDPLSKAQHINCVKKGLVKAFDAGDVSAEQLIKLAHSVDGLRSFADVLMEVPEELWASCWSKSMEAPFEVPATDIAKVCHAAAKDTIWQQITDLANEWIESLHPRKVAPVLGFRSTTKAKPKFDPEGIVVQGGKIRMQLDALRDMADDLPKGEITTMLKQIPWQELSDLLDKEITWKSFLQDAGSILRAKLQPQELSTIEQWLHSGYEARQDCTSSLKLLELMLSTANLPRL